MSLKTYAGCNLCQAKTGIDPTNVILEGSNHRRLSSATNVRGLYVIIWMIDYGSFSSCSLIITEIESY
jgi:hypothetical protein